MISIGFVTPKAIIRHKLNESSSVKKENGEENQSSSVKGRNSFQNQVLKQLSEMTNKPNDMYKNELE